MPELPEGVKVPEEAVEAAYLSLDGEQLKWLASAPPSRKALVRDALGAAMPAILAAERERWGAADVVERMAETLWWAATHRGTRTNVSWRGLPEGHREYWRGMAPEAIARLVAALDSTKEKAQQ